MFTVFQQLENNISSLLLAHHDVYPALNVKDQAWEYILARSIRDQNPSFDVEWKPGSQKVGWDIRLNNTFGISCKTGQIHSDDRIKISSSRLSRFPDFNAIRNYLATTRTDDCIVSLATRKLSNSKTAIKAREKPHTIDYVCSVYDSSVFDYANMQWNTKGSGKNIVHVGENRGITVTITPQMGYQLWYYMPLNLAKQVDMFSIPVPGGW